MIPSSSSFSIKRALAFGRLYQPTLGRMIMIYPAISFALTVLTIFLGCSKTGVPFIALVSLVVSFMIYFSPLVFVAGGDPVIETMLPAKGSEKAWFMIMCSLLLFPTLVWIPQQIIEWIANWLNPAILADNYFYNLRNELGEHSMVVSYLQILVPTATCLATVARERRRRIVTPVIWTLVSIAGLAIAGMAVGFVKFFKIGMNHARMGLDPYDTEEINRLVHGELNTILSILAVMCVVYIIVMGYISYRNISKRQI